MRNVQAVIGRLRWKLKKLILLLGMGYLLITLCLLSAATFVCDYLFRLPAGVRLILLGVSLVMVASVAFRRLIRPLLRPMTDDDLALCIESACPESDCRVISALQISRIMNDHRLIFSRQLANHLIAETEGMVGGLDIAKATRSGPMWKKLGQAAVLLVILGGACAYEPEYFTKWLNRIFGGNAEYPRSTDLAVEYPHMVVKGDDVVVKITPRKGDPSRVRLYYKFESGDKGWAMAERTATGGKEYFYTFKQTMEPFSFLVSGGDYESDYFPVAIKLPPRIEDISLYMKYPDYTMIPPTGRDEPQKNGNVKAIVGTEVTVIGESNIPVSSATIIFREGEKERLENMTVSGGIKVAGTFVAGRNCDYEINLQSTEGLKNREPVKYKVEVLPDRPPNVSIKKPASDMEATATAVVPVSIAAMDDFGVKDLSLVVRIMTKDMEVNEQSAGEERRLSVSFNGDKERFGKKNVETVYLFDLSRLQAKDKTGSLRPLQVGDSVSYYVEAVDCNPVKGVGHSNKYIFTILSDAEILERIENVQKDILNDLNNILAEQERNLGDTQDMSKMLEKAAIGAQESNRLFNLGRTQEQITVGCRKASDRLTVIVSQVEIFKLSNLKISEKLRLVQGYLDKIASDKSPLAHEMIKNSSTSKTEPAKLLGKSADVQKEIVGDLKAAITLMREWADISHIIRTIEGAKTKQKGVVDVLSGGQPKSPDEEEKNGNDPKKKKE